MNDLSEFVDTRETLGTGPTTRLTLEDLLPRPPITMAGDGGTDVLALAPLDLTFSELIMALSAIPGSATGVGGGIIIVIIPPTPPPGEPADLADTGGEVRPRPLRPSICASNPSNEAPRAWARPPVLPPP